MRKLFTVVILVLLVAAFAYAAGKDASMTCWVSDAHCGAKGNNASHASCAKACVKGGEKAVFVSDKDGKVYAITNQDAVKDHVGDHVTVTATAKGDALDISKVEAAGEKK